MTDSGRRTRGVARAMRELAAEMSRAALHRAGVAAAERFRGRRGLRLHLGCGDRPLEGWINVDLAGAPDLTLDLRERLPFDDASVARACSEHFLEHLELEDARRLLGEALRVLEPGGELRLAVPDAAWPVRAYAAGDDQYFRLARELWHPPWCDTRMHQLNYHFRQQGEHRYAYDFETLRAMLVGAGFADVESRAFDPATDSEERRPGTLYVAAVKPSR